MALSEVTLGPVLFNWPPERWRDFYFRIADEAPVSTVYVGEVVCSKRAPLFADHIEQVVSRLQNAGKTVVFSSLAEVALDKDRDLIESICAADENLVEANDASALFHLKGRVHHIGPFVNTYNERTAEALMRNGACNFCLPAELPGSAIQALSATIGVSASIEVLVFGRTPLALSARCYHARAHGRTKDSCQFVCDEDPDGLELKTLDGQPFLAINGIQTLSYEYLNLLAELPALRAMGVSRFRISPHSGNTAAVAQIVCNVLDGRLDPAEANAMLAEHFPGAKFCNGFFHGKPGHLFVDGDQRLAHRAVQ